MNDANPPIALADVDRERIDALVQGLSALRVLLTAEPALGRHVVDPITAAAADWPGFTIPSARPCVVVMVEGVDRFVVQQYLDGRRAAGYAPRNLADLLSCALPEALRECVQALGVNRASSDPK